MSEEGFQQRGYRVIGRVQGVFFRAWTQEMAEELGVVGTVRNRADGSVEAHVAGTAEELESFERRLLEGSPSARVERVEVFESEAGLPKGQFQILY